MDNEELYDKALEAIVALFSDHTVSQSKCTENLHGLVGEIEIMLNSLET